MFPMAEMNAQRIKKLRRRLEWTQSKLAKQVGVSLRTLQYWEKKGCRPGSPAEQILKTLE